MLKCLYVVIHSCRVLLVFELLCVLSVMRVRVLVKHSFVSVLMCWLCAWLGDKVRNNDLLGFLDLFSAYLFRMFLDLNE